MRDLKPCPFCGWQPPTDDADFMLDVLHKSGSWWADRPFYGKTYRTYRSYREREEGDQPCWEMNCNENMGGCGARVVADTELEVVQKWNRRV